jgi:uncharacterized paraquat-inducible protein A
MTYITTRDRAALDTRRRDLATQLQACGAPACRQCSDAHAELVEVEAEIDEAARHGDWGYCEHCGTEQPPPTREEPRCSRCGGWLYPDVRA